MSKVKLTTLTPIHVGNGNLLQKNIEFIQMNYEGSFSAGIVDDRKVLDIIGQDRINDWVSVIENRESLVDFIKARKPDLTLDELSRRVMLIDAKSSDFLSIKEQIHNGEGRPFIPGSSLKGSFRSAVFNQEIRGNGERISRERIISTNKQNNSVASAKTLEKELFGNNPNEDIFRFLQIGDAYFEKGQTVALDLKSLNIVRDGDKVELDRKVHQLVEVIDAECNAELDLKINTSLFEINKAKGYIKKNPDWLTDLNELFTLVNKNTIQILSEEIEFWEPDERFDPVGQYLLQLKELISFAGECVEGECVTRLGHGVGWTFINGAWTKDENILSDEIYEELVGLTRRNNKKYREYPFPKTRRVADSGDVELLGFVKLSLI